MSIEKPRFESEELLKHIELARSKSIKEFSNVAAPDQIPRAWTPFMESFTAHLIGYPVAYAVISNGSIQLVPKDSPGATPLFSLGGLQNVERQKDNRSAHEIIDSIIERFAQA